MRTLNSEDNEANEEAEIVYGTAEVFAALGDATRLTMLIRLSSGGMFSIVDLAEGTGLSRQAVAKHLRVLERAGLVIAGQHGRERLYEIEPEPLQETRACLDMVLADWTAPWEG